MKKILLLIISSSALLTAVAQQPAADTVRMTLEDCLDYAMGNSFSRQTLLLDQEAIEDSYKQSRLEMIPSVSANLGENFSHGKDAATGAEVSNWSGNYSIDASVTLTQGGQITQTIKQNRLRREQMGYKTAQYDNELTIQILESFLAVLGNEELLKYQSEVVKASEEQVRQGKSRLDAGDIIESDYLLLEAQLSSDKNNITETIVNRNNSLLALKSLMSMSLTQPVALIYPDTSAMHTMMILPGEQDFVERVLEISPDMEISNYNVEIARSGLQISRSGFYPSLKLNGSISTGHSRNFQNYGQQLEDNFGQKVGISLSIPIFNGNKTRSQVNQSRIALMQAELNRQQTELNFRQTLHQEYGSVVSASGKYQTSEIKQSAYLKSFEAYRSKFDAGAITAVELLQQQNNYISSMYDYIQSKYGFMLKRKILDVYLGESLEM